MKKCREVGETILSILEGAIKSEVDSEKRYLHGADLASDPCVRELFLSLAKMEQEHKELLTKQLDQLKAQLTVVGELNEMFE